MSAGPSDSSHPHLRASLDVICESLNFSFSDLAQLLQEDPDTFSKEVDLARQMPAKTLRKIADRFDITLEALISGAVDPLWIRQTYEKRQVLPNRYRFAAGSKFRTSLPIFSYLSTNWGQPFLRSLMRELRVPYGMLEVPDQNVSIRLLNDVLELLMRRGFDRSDFREMGYQVSRIPANSKMKNAYRTSRNSLEVFDRLCNEVIRRYERNFNYVLVQSSSQGVKMRVTATSEMQEVFKGNRIDSPNVCLYREGALAAQPEFIQEGRSYSCKVACVHQGDSACLYEFEW